MAPAVKKNRKSEGKGRKSEGHKAAEDDDAPDAEEKGVSQLLL